LLVELFLFCSVRLPFFFYRIVQVVLEQGSDNDYLMARVIRIYAPYWISFARLPPLTLRVIDMSGRKNKRRFLTRPHLERSEKHLYDIKPDELVEGYTIASGLNFKGLGLSSSVSRHGGRFGSMKELSSLGDMVRLNLLFFNQFDYNDDVSYLFIFNVGWYN
jgi:vacuolar protein sorting-associated protein 13A/C